MFVVVPLLFFVPGLLLAAAVGLRGWRLAAVAPAVTFGLVGTGGAALDALGARWTLLSFAVWTAALALVLGVIARLLGHRREARAGAPAPDDAAAPLRRARWEHVIVGAGVLLGMAVGAVSFLHGTGGLGVTSQEWDAPFHANAVRWIAEHGHAVPAAVAPINGLAPGQPYFYPITYHSLLALGVQQFGLGPSWILNAAALTVVLCWPLGVAGLGMSWRVPAPIVAVAATVSTWFSAFPYDSLWRGPLWPYVAGLALLPGVLAAGRMLIERVPVFAAGLVIAFGVTGIVSMHPSIAFIVLVYVGALVVAFLLRLEPIHWRTAGARLVGAGVMTVLVLLPVVLPARAASGGVEASRWPEFATQAEGFGQVLLFSPTNPLPQWWLGLTALAGLVVMVRRRRLVWVVGAYVVIGAAYAATASIDDRLVNLISGPFYNDAWRLAAPLPLAGAFAVGEVVIAVSSWLAPRLRLRLGRSWVGAVAVATAAVVVLGLLGDDAYIHRNSQLMSQSYGNGPTVSNGEKAAYAWLARHVRPGEQVMNDRFDGSVWMYAMAGVQPMDWTFYGPAPGSVADRLETELNWMDRSQVVRTLVVDAHVRYVIVGRGFVRSGMKRLPGLRNLAQVHGLEQVFHNSDATIYQIVGLPGEANS